MVKKEGDFFYVESTDESQVTDLDLDIVSRDALVWR